VRRSALIFGLIAAAASLAFAPASSRWSPGSRRPLRLARPARCRACTRTARTSTRGTSMASGGWRQRQSQARQRAGHELQAEQRDLPQSDVLEHGARPRQGSDRLREALRPAITRRGRCQGRASISGGTACASSPASSPRGSAPGSTCTEAGMGSRSKCAARSASRPPRRRSATPTSRRRCATTATGPTTSSRSPSRPSPPPARADESFPWHPSRNGLDRGVHGGGGNRTRVRGSPARASTSLGCHSLSPAGR
jgi:hypothetical protein